MERGGCFAPVMFPKVKVLDVLLTRCPRSVQVYHFQADSEQGNLARQDNTKGPSAPQQKHILRCDVCCFSAEYRDLSVVSFCMDCMPLECKVAKGGAGVDGREA